MVIAILLLSVLIGSLLGAFFSLNKNGQGLLLSFSGAFLLSITLLEIFPHIYAHEHGKEMGFVVLLGVLLQLVLESITRGAEHGHFHHHKESSFPFAVFTGLLLHAFVEGIPLQNGMNANLVWGVAVHKIPVAMVLYIFLCEITQTKWKIYLFMLIFALASPLGNTFGKFLSPHYLEWALALAAGVFLHISTVIIFESTDNHQIKLKKIAALVSGIILAYFSIGCH